DLGCGSARHATQFARKGLQVTGVDSSERMIAQACERVRDSPSELRERVCLVQDNVASFTPQKTYDAVVSLFHVLNYQTTDDALSGIFQTAHKALCADGVFVFDFWYGPAVIAQGPERRQRRAETNGLVLTRLAEPVHDAERH